MIQITITYSCRVCASLNIVRNGHNQYGNAQYHCHDCGAYRVLDPQPAFTLEAQEQVLRTYKERASLRGLERIFGVSHQTVLRWLKARAQELPDLKDTLLSAQPDDVLELDEIWSFVLKKTQKRWLWTAICRRIAMQCARHCTRQIVAFVIGDRSEKTCQRLWEKIPASYKACHTFSDFWEAYKQVFPKADHRCVGKQSGETAHIERWYNTFRQRLARFVRKTLSFSKSDVCHHIVTKWFITEYNLALSLIF